MQLVFEQATKKAAKARIALDGPSGSGKTYTALMLASALSGRIAVIDTEHRSASKYADLFEFDTLALDTYDPQILIEALAVAGQHGYDVVIVDSLSHFWMGVNGMLEQVDRATKRAGGHGMAGWKEMRPVERRMVDALLAYPGHVIVTMRVKVEWVQGENPRTGKPQMVKVGTKPEQREGLEYEFDIVGSLDLENELTVTKTRCPQLSGAVVSKPGRELGEVIKAWLDEGESAPTATQIRDEVLANPDATVEELRGFYQRAERYGLLGAAIVTETGESASLREWIRGRAMQRQRGGLRAVEAA